MYVSAASLITAGVGDRRCIKREAGDLEGGIDSRWRNVQRIKSLCSREKQKWTDPETNGEMSKKEGMSKTLTSARCERKVGKRWWWLVAVQKCTVVKIRRSVYGA